MTSIESTFEPVARRDRAAGRDDRRLRHLAEVFYKNVRRARLTETQAALANLICDDSLALGRRSVVYDSLEDFVQESVALPPVLHIGKSEVHRALVGSPGSDPARHERGLAQLGVVRVERLALDGRTRWVVTPALDWRGWSCAWRNTVERRQARNETLTALYGAALPYLPALAIEPDLNDALDAIACESVALPPVATAVADARSCPRKATPVRSRWESTNADLHGNGEVIGKFPTRTVKQLNSNSLKQRTVQQLNSDDSTRLLNELEEQFARAHGAAEARREMVNSGGCWRMIARRWPVEFETQIGGLREHLDAGGRFRTRAWFYLQHYMARAVSCQSWGEVCEKSKESFTSAPQAR